MAVSAFALWEVEQNGSTNNAGGFDPSLTGVLTDLTATSANTASPVVSSASYSFVAGDVGAWVFIKSGTSWTAGWYKISSVSSGSATLSAGIGAGTLYAGGYPTTPTTAAGCATVASPTGGTWGIDYSQQAAAQVALTGLSATINSTTLTGTGFSKTWVGNAIQFTGGANFTQNSSFFVTAVASGTSLTLDRAPATSGAGSSGTGNLGGAFNLINRALTIGMVASNIIWVKYNASAYAQATAFSSSLAVTPTYNAHPTGIYGYNSTHGDAPTGANRPVLQATAAIAQILNLTGNGWWTANLILDANSNATSCLVNTGNFARAYNLECKNFKSGGYGISFSGNEVLIISNEVHGGASGATAGINVTQTSILYNNYVHDNASPGIVVTNGYTVTGNIIYNNTGASSIGIQAGNTGIITHNDIANNGSDGIQLGALNTEIAVTVQNNILDSNGGYGINIPTNSYSLVGSLPEWDFNSFFSNTSGARNNMAAGLHDVTLTGSPFNNKGTDFGLNNSAGQGAACRGSGFPQSFPGLSSTAPSPDIGAVQHAASGGGGGTVGWVSVG